MRKETGRPCKLISWVAKLATALIVFFQFSASAQQPTIRDFVLFGGNSTQIGTSTTINGGRIGSNKLVQTIGNTNITADINSANRVQLANSNTVRGNITAENKVPGEGAVFSAGSNFSFPNNKGEIHVGGNVTIQSGTVRGTVYMPVTASYSGPKADRSDNPKFPQLPALPPALPFMPAGTDDVTTTGSVKPTTAYRNLQLGGGKSVTFDGPGIYTFNSIKISNSDNRLILDFQDKASGFIVIHVHGDVDLDKVNVQLVRGGHPSRVYMEVHGNGSTSPSGKDAWRIANGASGSTSGIWYGAVWAPNGGIFVGQGSSPSKIEGALWSGTDVTIGSGVAVTYVAPLPCPPAVADAGADKILVCPATQVSIGSASSSGTMYTWTTVLDGTETIVGTTPVINVTRKGTYTLTVSNGCGNAVTDVVEVGYESCVEPINPNTGKTEELIGHELMNLSTNLEEAKKHLIILGENDEYVLIEAVAVLGQEEAALSFLREHGLINEIPNGIAYQIISGQFPIKNLQILNTRPDLFNHCRPVFLPLGNAGVATSEGDKAIAANLAREGFKIGGEGIKIGVISDSYNKSDLLTDKAKLDINNGDLPGAGNPDGNTSPVEPLIDYPYGVRSDEGRAMLQIVHDLAPKAKLAFRTGFVSAGDMAQGIIKLKEAGCQVIVDDVTYITEPFFQDGVIARTVNAVNNAGVAYFTSAGNFGQKSYTSTYRSAPAPGNIANSAHDFSGSGDIYQRLRLKAGTYSIVLQWQDAIYSLAQTQGTVNDLDIYLIDQGGERIGFNRNNFGGDPFEILSFSIKHPDPSQYIEADLLITKANNTANTPLIKYIIFRGEAIIDEYYSNQSLLDKSTIVGHANAEGAISVGAVLFSNTTPYGITPSTASFSSSGGSPVFVNGVKVVRQKPEITAPNGVNTSTTVVMGPDIDFVKDPVNGSSDGFPNFFGTSASAPHAAAAAALIMSARKKFYGQDLNAASLRDYLFETALDMQPDGVVNGWNYKAGHGLVQPYAAIRTFASPTPRIDELVYDREYTPGETPLTLQVKGEHFTDNTVIYYRGQPVETEMLDEHTLEANITILSAIRSAINVYNAPFPGTTSANGGFSNTLYLFADAKLKVVLKADDKQKKYGEVLPPNTMSISVNGDPLAVFNEKFNENLSAESLGLNIATLRYADPTVNALSGVGPYRIDVTRVFDPANPADDALLELYDYTLQNGNLEITKLPVTISPQDFTVNYGDPLDNFSFNYVFDPSANIADEAALTNAIKTAHELHVDNTVLGVMNSTGGGAAVFFQNQLLPVYQNAAIIYENKLYPIIANASGTAVIILNGVPYSVANSTTTGLPIVEIDGQEYPVVNGGGAVVILQGQILPVINRSIGGAVVILNDQEYPVVNSPLTGGAVVILNGEEFPVINGGGGAVILLNGQYLPVVNSRLTGGAVVILNGEEYPVVNSRLTGGAVVILNGEEYPVQNNLRTAVTILNGQLYDVFPNATGGTAVVILNGDEEGTAAPYLNGAGGSAVVILNGQILPVINRSIGGAVVILNGVAYPVVNSTRLSGGAVVILNGEEVPLVNSISPATLTNMSMSATLNAIANARTMTAQPNKFIDVAANAFVQFNSNTSTSTLLNALAYVNARTLVDANKLANGEEVLVNRTGATAVTVLNGSGAYVNSSSLDKSSTVKTPVIYDQADLNSAVGNISTISMEGINMITGINSGEQYIIPATLFSPNFEITYDVGKVTIKKAPLNLKASNVTKEVGDLLNLNPSNFSIITGSTKYTEKIAVANLTSTGAEANATIGTYPIQISNAIGSYGTDIGNYEIEYTSGNLQVVSSCPVIVHSRNNSFVNTETSQVSLWLNVQIKVRGQLTKEGDSIELRSGKLVLENIRYENQSELRVERGVIIATKEVTAPVSHYDTRRRAFVTRVPLGFSSTADIFITGAVVNSKNGFTKSKNAGSVLSGVFRSNVNFDGQWNYAMAAYSAASTSDYIQYSQLAADESVVAMSSSSLKAGTPMPWISRITAGGTGNGGTNYTGSPSNYDNFSSCVPASTSNRTYLTSVGAGEESGKTATVQETSLQAFPNPARDHVTLSFLPPVTGNATIQVVGANGSRVVEIYRGMVEANRFYTRKIDTHQWTAGVYIIQVVLNDRIINRKLVISP
ncbi:MAG TPA: S8 family serine peptidase [Flavisolibacter sp.]|jgi:hypothetical protein|nr:S8 family serine peptidase [Flavisolibacter sp.]